MTLSEVKNAIEELKQFNKKGGITPESLATLLENILNALEENDNSLLTLEVSVADNKKQFLMTEDFSSVWEKMSAGEYVRFCIAINYASGLHVWYNPTCVKPSYISIHAKSGSCELHVNEDGSFTTSGTSLW